MSPLFFSTADLSSDHQQRTVNRLQILECISSLAEIAEEDVRLPAVILWVSLLDPKRIDSERFCLVGSRPRRPLISNNRNNGTMDWSTVQSLVDRGRFSDCNFFLLGQAHLWETLPTKPELLALLESPDTRVVQVVNLFLHLLEETKGMEARDVLRVSWANLANGDMQHSSHCAEFQGVSLGLKLMGSREEVQLLAYNTDGMKAVPPCSSCCWNLAKFSTLMKRSVQYDPSTKEVRIIPGGSSAAENPSQSNSTTIPALDAVVHAFEKIAFEIPLFQPARLRRSVAVLIESFGFNPYGNTFLLNEETLSILVFTESGAWVEFSSDMQKYRVIFDNFESGLRNFLNRPLLDFYYEVPWIMI